MHGRAGDRVPRAMRRPRSTGASGSWRGATGLSRDVQSGAPLVQRPRSRPRGRPATNQRGTPSSGPLTRVPSPVHEPSSIRRRSAARESERVAGGAPVPDLDTKLKHVRRPRPKIPGGGETDYSTWSIQATLRRAILVSPCASTPLQPPAKSR